MPKPKIRHADIAREADASIATVDRVLNGRAGVSSHTSQRIWDAVHRLEGQGGQGGKTSRARKIRLQFDYILPGGPNTFWEQVVNGAEAAGQAMAEDGVDIQCHLIEGFNSQALADTIHKVSAHSDGIAVVALENPMVREAVNACFDAGVPIVTVVSNLSTPKKTAYVGLNNRAAGRTAGYLMGRFLAGQKGEIALFEGSLDLSYRDHQERDIGFRDVLRELFPDISVTIKHPTHDNHTEAYLATKTVLEQHPDVLGIYNVGGGIRGNARAIQEIGKSADIVLIGHELTDYSRKLLIDGTLDAVIDQDPEFQAREAARVLLEHHTKGPDSINPRMPRIGVFIRENMP